MCLLSKLFDTFAYFEGYTINQYPNSLLCSFLVSVILVSRLVSLVFLDLIPVKTVFFQSSLLDVFVLDSSFYISGVEDHLQYSCNKDFSEL